MQYGALNDLIISINDLRRTSLIFFQDA